MQRQIIVAIDAGKMQAGEAHASGAFGIGLQGLIKRCALAGKAGYENRHARPKPGDDLLNAWMRWHVEVRREP